MRRCYVDPKEAKGCKAEIVERIREWMQAHGITAVELRPVSGRRYYAIYFNGLPDPVPGVVLAEEDLEDPEVLISTLEAARVVFDYETGKAD